MKLFDHLQKPKPYERGASIWTDEYIAPQMLQAHLNPDIDVASYSKERMEQTCRFLYTQLQLAPGAVLIDLGCGPGLYAEHFAAKDIQVTGLDISDHSITYARKQAKQNALDITYTVQNYCKPFGTDCYDAAMLVWEDYGVLAPVERKMLLANVHAALRPGGTFALDVATEQKLTLLNETAVWNSYKSGFFRPYAHVVLEKTWLFPEEHAYCETSVVIDDSITVYHNHLTWFTKDLIIAELEASGFNIEKVTGNLAGEPYTDSSLQIGLVVSRR